MAPTFPAILLHHAAVPLATEQAPYEPERWMLSIMERAQRCEVVDWDVAHLWGCRSGAEGSMDWQYYQLHKRWRQFGVNRQTLSRLLDRVHLAIHRFPRYLQPTELPVLARLYTDGGSRKGQKWTYGGVLVIGTVVVLEYWGAVQTNARGNHYWGSLGSSSKMGELGAYGGLALAIGPTQLWPAHDRSGVLWPVQNLLCVLDNKGCMNALAGASFGPKECSFEVCIVDAWNRFLTDRDLRVAYQHVDSHIGVRYNERADELAALARDLPLGEFAYKLYDTPDNRRQIAWLQQRGIAAFPPAHTEKIRPGTQTSCYRYAMSKQLLTGLPHHVFAERVHRWWGVRWNQ